MDIYVLPSAQETQTPPFRSLLEERLGGAPHTVYDVQADGGGLWRLEEFGELVAAGLTPTALVQLTVEHGRRALLVRVLPEQAGLVRTEFAGLEGVQVHDAADLVVDLPAFEAYEPPRYDDAAYARMVARAKALREEHQQRLAAKSAEVMEQLNPFD